MLHILAFLGRLARATAAVGLFVAFFLTASYLRQNSPQGAQRRHERENAAIVSTVAEIYRANDWFGDQDSLDGDAADCADCLVAASPVSMP